MTRKERQKGSEVHFPTHVESTGDVKLVSLEVRGKSSRNMKVILFVIMLGERRKNQNRSMIMF